MKIKKEKVDEIASLISDELLVDVLKNQFESICFENFKENLNWHKEIKISGKTIKCEIGRRKWAADFIGYACCVHVDKSLGK